MEEERPTTRKMELELIELRMDRSMSERFEVLHKAQTRDHKETLEKIEAIRTEINGKIDPMYKVYEGFKMTRSWFTALIVFLILMATFFTTFRNFIIAALMHLK